MREGDFGGRESEAWGTVRLGHRISGGPGHSSSGPLIIGRRLVSGGAGASWIPRRPCTADWRKLTTQVQDSQPSAPPQSVDSEFDGTSRFVRCESYRVSTERDYGYRDLQTPKT